MSNGQSGGKSSCLVTRQRWDTRDARVDDSMFDALQVFLCARVGVTQGEGGAVFLGGSMAVSLPFQQLAQQIVSLEGRAFLDRRGKITAEQSHRLRIAAADAQQKAGTIHERFRSIHRAGFHGTERLLHFVETVGVSEKDSQIKPGARS